MVKPRFSVLGPLMGGHGSRAFLGRVHEDDVDGTVKTRPVVFVFLPPEVEDQPEVMAQIVEETRIASRIDHPNVIGVWGVAHLDEGAARIVDFANGESVRAVLRRVRDEGIVIPANIAAAIAADAAMGVHYAHELGISETGLPMVHGGVRPETLLVTFEGRGMVTGYGASTLAEWFRRGQGVDASMRDPYTAPEQAFGGRAAATVGTDVYALGTVLWELLTGESPPGHHRPDDTEAFERNLIETKLAHAGPMLPGIVMKALRSLAPARYATPLDMRHALLDAGVADASAVTAFLESLFPAGSLGRAARDDLIASPLEPNSFTSTTSEVEIPEWAPAPTVHESGEFSTIPTAAPEVDDAPLVVIRNDTPVPAQTPAPTSSQAPAPTSSQAPAPTSSQAPAPTSSQAPAPAEAVHPVTAPFARPTPNMAPPPAAPIAPAPAPMAYAQPAPASSGIPTNAILLVLVGLLGGALIFALFLRNTGDDVVDVKKEAAAEVEIAAQAKKAEAELKEKLEAAVAAALADKEAEQKALAQALVEKAKTDAAKAKPKKSGRRRRQPKKSASGLSQYATSDYATLYVEAPPGTTVLVDGKKKGVTPMSPLKLSVGRHTVHAKKNGGNVRKTFRIGAGQEVTFTARFRVIDDVK